MTDVAALIVAGTGALSLMGAGTRWVWTKVEKRITLIETKADACEEREAKSDATIRRLTWEVRRDGQAVRLLFMELHKLDPGNSTLMNVAVVLRQQYQPDLAMPDDMADLLARIGAHTQFERT